MALSLETTNELRTCAFCPNTCRPSYAADEALQIESQTPSALCLLALAVLEKRMPHDEAARTTLSRRAAAQASRGHCTYGLDVPALLDRAFQEA